MVKVAWLDSDQHTHVNGLEGLQLHLLLLRMVHARKTGEHGRPSARLCEKATSAPHTQASQQARGVFSSRLLSRDVWKPPRIEKMPTLRGTALLLPAIVATGIADWSSTASSVADRISAEWRNARLKAKGLSLIHI